MLIQEMVKDLKDKYGITYPICNSTVLTWMHNSGGEFVNRQMNYYCDGHENDLNKQARREYILRDKGTEEEPSLRELGQYQWVQLTEEKGEEFINAHSPEVQDQLRKKTFKYMSKTKEGQWMLEFHVESSEKFDVRSCYV